MSVHCVVIRPIDMVIVNRTQGHQMIQRWPLTHDFMSIDSARLIWKIYAGTTAAVMLHLIKKVVKTFF